jgi:L-lactate dehydrogenase complex protein LldE
MKDIVQLFATCLVDSLFPDVGAAVVEILGRVGLQVSFPQDQTCCGQLAFNAGLPDQALQMARSTIEVFSGTVGPVIVPSGSCAAMIRQGYPELFREDPLWLPRAKALANRVFEFSEFIVDQLQVHDVGAIYPGRLAYHPSCHLTRDLGIQRQPLSLLRIVRGAEVQPLSTECCGFGGVFAIDQHEISTEMLQRRITQIHDKKADIVVACDVSCLMQIEGGLRRIGSPVRCSHIAQVLAGQEKGLR